MLVRNLGFAFAAVFVLVPARAGVTAADYFSSPPYTVGTLARQTVAGTGFAGTWAFLPGLGSLDLLRLLSR